MARKSQSFDVLGKGEPSVTRNEATTANASVADVLPKLALLAKMEPRASGYMLRAANGR